MTLVVIPAATAAPWPTSITISRGARATYHSALLTMDSSSAFFNWSGGNGGCNQAAISSGCIQPLLHRRGDRPRATVVTASLVPESVTGQSRVLLLLQ